VEGAEHLEAILAARRPVIVCLWHNRALLGTPFLRDGILRRGLPMTLLVSQSSDGEILARFVISQGAGVVRGSSTRGGRQALRGAVRAIAEEGASPIIVPDGPVGPVYRFKPGALQMARLTGAPIVLLGFAAGRSKALGSWDRLIVPWPFTRIAVVVGAPETIERDLPAAALEARRSALEERLAAVDRRAEKAVGASDPAEPGPPLDAPVEYAFRFGGPGANRPGLALASAGLPSRGSEPEETDMPDLDDVQLDQPGHEGDGGGSRGSGGRWLRWLVIAVVVVLIAAGTYWGFLVRRASAPPPEPAPAPAPEPAPEVAPAPAPAEEAEPMPPLSDSDELVRRVVEGLSKHPALASYLVSDHLVRRFVLVVDNVAAGLVPRPILPESLKPDRPFKARESGGVTVADPASYRRYDAPAAVFASIAPEGAVAAYLRLRPLIAQASEQNLGYGADRFDRSLRKAILHLLETPVPADPPALERQVLSYHYADPRLENLSEAQKQLLRMGPDNERRVQGELRKLARALGVPAGQIPQEIVYRPGE
jgi:lysophospholipid acyltransferase (LPLAT)-like uncharacterized protein